jgi:hypothetical protein
MHKYLATIFDKLSEENQILEWMMPGATICIPKNENIEKGKNYRLVTCLLKIHKTIIYLLTYLLTYLRTYLITYLLNGADSFLGTNRFLVNKFLPALYGTRRFIVTFTGVRHLSLPQARSI